MARPLDVAGDPGPAWPPVAARQGVDLSAAAVVVIAVGAVFGEFLIFALVARASPHLTSYGSVAEAVTREVVLPSAIAVGLTLAVVLMTGSRRACGLVAGIPAPWGLVPATIFALATMLTVGLPEVSAKGGAVICALLLGLLLAALFEELVFRGFLLHGLTTRVGGRSAVLIGSMLFAAAHLPSLARSPRGGASIAITLVMHFGFGVLLCRIRTATGTIWYVTEVHTLWNFVTVGVVGWAYPGADPPAAFVLLKLVPIVVGLAIAIRLARSPARSPGGAPPMPHACTVLAPPHPVLAPMSPPVAFPPPPRPDVLPGPR